MEENMACNWTW